MNPVVTEQPTGFTAYQLTEEDLKLAQRVVLINGAGSSVDHAMRKMCVMQLATLMTLSPEEREKVFHADPYGEENGLSTSTVCVSGEITRYLVELNDFIMTIRTRKQLIGTISDILNTCPVKRTVLKTKIKEERRETKEYKEAELKRREILDRIDPEAPNVSVKKKLDLVREAANVYRTGPGLATAQEVDSAAS